MNRSREQELVLLAAAGDRQAASELVRAHQQRLYAFLLRMTGKHDVAEEVAQEAFVRALRSLSRFDPQYRFSTWLFTIARRVYWNMCEKMKPVVSSNLIAQVSNVSPVWTLAGWASEQREDNNQQRSALQQALIELPPAQREIVILYHQQDWTVGQIAQLLGIPKGTVKSHLHRGRNRLRVCLSELGWDRLLEPGWCVDSMRVDDGQEKPSSVGAGPLGVSRPATGAKAPSGADRGSARQRAEDGER